MSGFVAAYREVIDHPLFIGNAERLGAWMWLVMRAAWKPIPFDVAGKVIMVERGQVCTSRAQMAKAWGMSPSGVERFLTRLKTEQMIEQETGQGRSIITICNYAKYQDVSDDAGQASEQPTGQRSDSDRTAKEQGNKGTSIKDDKSSSVDLGTGEAIECWRLAANQSGWPIPARISAARRKKLESRLQENTLEGWKEALRKALRSERLGRDPPGWFTFDWLTKNPENILKVLEGNYDKRFENNGNGGSATRRPDWRDALAGIDGADVRSPIPPTDQAEPGLLRIAGVAE